MPTTSTGSKASSSGGSYLTPRRGIILLIALAAALAAWLLMPRAADLPLTNPSLVPIVSGLDHPWGLAFLPDSNALVTERPGNLRYITMPDGKLSEPIAGLPELDVEGQGGLLGIAIDPDFASNRFIYLSFAEPREGGNSTSVFRAKLSADNSTLEESKIIFRQNVPAESGHHFGSRLVFDRNGHLFVTTGDRNMLRDLVQDPSTHIGKVIRITRDGAPAPGNPSLPGWAPEIWSMGHRNIQGATLHPETGALWTAEHGARGGDEINTPEAGKNYGWPVITFGRDYSGEKIGEGTAMQGMEQPLHYWDPSIAPSGMAFYTGDVYPGWKGNLFVGALAGQLVARLTLDGNKIVSEQRLFEGHARFRDVVQGPDGRLYLLTDESNGTLLVISK
jgi:glucose/arabinose dehydrogenase